MSKTTTILEDEHKQIEGLNNGKGYAIIKTLRLNDLAPYPLCGRQDVKDLPMLAKVFGKGFENYSVVIKLDKKEKAIEKVANKFPGNAVRIAVYLTNEVSRQTSITEQLRTASE
ncbi:MAG: hypothetical protein KGH60_00185 [Candidatus Micrarchaeota archaeon]|nr:hypothetical protein [Candidatus Micrarchaeota archaeon]